MSGARFKRRTPQLPASAALPQYEIADLPRLGWLRLEHCGEENLYFRLPDGSAGFVKHGG